MAETRKFFKCHNNLIIFYDKVREYEVVILFLFTYNISNGKLFFEIINGECIYTEEKKIITSYF